MMFVCKYKYLNTRNCGLKKMFYRDDVFSLLDPSSSNSRWEYYKTVPWINSLKPTKDKKKY